MLKKRNILLGFLCFVVLFMLTGCGNVTVKNTSEFKSLSERNKYTTSDVTSQYSANQNVKEATVAKISQDSQIEFFVFADEVSARQMFSTNKVKLESEKSGFSNQSQSNAFNYSTYSLTYSNKYMYLCRVDNTLLFINTLTEFKDNANKFIEEFGY